MGSRVPCVDTNQRMSSRARLRTLMLRDKWIWLDSHPSGGPLTLWRGRTEGGGGEDHHQDSPVTGVGHWRK